MKKRLWIIGLLLAVSVLCSCSRKADETSGYQVYFTNAEADQIIEDVYVPKTEDEQELISELLEYLKIPQNSYNSSIPSEVQVVSHELTDGHLVIDFSQAYLELDNVTEVILRASVVQTLIQIPSVKDIRFTVEGEILYDVSGMEIGAMNEKTFIDTKGEGINSYQYAALNLYFMDETGEKLQKESRNVHYSSNASIEAVIIEQLAEGPVNQELAPVIPADTYLISSSISNQTCTLNFDKSLLEGTETVSINPEASIYAIVNSICDACDVTTVKFQVNGSAEVFYCEQVDLSQSFQWNSDFISSNGDSNTEVTETAATETEVVDPEVGVESVINNETQITETGDEE